MSGAKSVFSLRTDAAQALRHPSNLPLRCAKPGPHVLRSATSRSVKPASLRSFVRPKPFDERMQTTNSQWRSLRERQLPGRLNAPKKVGLASGELDRPDGARTCSNGLLRGQGKRAPKSSRRTSPVVFMQRMANRTRYAVDVTGGGRSSAMSHRMSATTFAIWNTPLPAVVFGPVIANGSFTSTPAVRCALNSGHSPTSSQLVKSTLSGRSDWCRNEEKPASRNRRRDMKPKRAF